METQSIICFDRVGKIYKGELFRKKTTALSDLSLDVRSGEVFGIIGPNGAGKSTALKILMGFVKHDTGNVILNNHPPSSPTCHKHVGFLPENPCLYEHLTIIDHLKFAAKISNIPAKKASEKIRQILDRVDLADSAKISIRRFSKGMTQRAALAYALFHDPNILILDEPMSGLDPLGRKMVVDIIKEYNQAGNTILFCSHILADVERICNRIGIMNKGRITTILKPEDINKPSFSVGGNEGASPLEILFMKTIKDDRYLNSHIRSEPV